MKYLFLIIVCLLIGCNPSPKQLVKPTNIVVEGSTIGGAKINLILSSPKIELSDGMTQEALYVDGTNKFYWIKLLGDGDIYYPMRHWKITN